MATDPAAGIVVDAADASAAPVAAPTATPMAAPAAPLPAHGLARIRQWLAFWPRAAVGSTGFVVAVCWYVLLRLVPTTNAVRRQSFARAMSRLCCRPLGIRLRVVGRERIEAHAPCIYVCNHQSQLDYPIGASVFPGNCLIIASQIGDWPVMGALFRSSGCITVEREVPVRAVAALDRAERAVREEGNSIWFFAEGTRGKIPGRMGPFRRGAFHLAVATGRPVVPVVISPLKPRTDLRGRRLERRDVTLRVLDAVFPPPGDATTADRRERVLRDTVRAAMEQALSAACRAADTGPDQPPGRGA